MPEAPQSNEPASRTETGEIKDQHTPTPETSTTTTTATPTTEAKPPAEATKAPADEGKTLLNKDDKKDGVLTGAPEKYETFKAPDGYEFKPDTVEGANTLFKELNLSQAGAQRLVDFHAEQIKAALEGPQQLWQDTQKQWVDQVKADPELGPNLDRVKATVARAIDGLGDSKLAAEFREAMDFTGAGNNPAFIKTFYKLALSMAEGRPATGGTASPQGQVAPGSRPATAAKALFPNLP